MDDIEEKLLPEAQSYQQTQNLQDHQEQKRESIYQSQVFAVKESYQENFQQSGRFSYNEKAQDDLFVPATIQTNFYDRFYQSLNGPKIQQTNRKIKLKGKVKPENRQNNFLKNQQYTILTFLPITLFNQFKYFYNLFFLLLAISQFYPPLQVGYMFTYTAPLGLVLMLSMIKQGYDDFKRYQRDKQDNNALYQVIQDGQLVKIESCKIQVGDMIEINGNQRVPADVALLYTSDPKGSVFIRTDQLDGETDWKLRKSVKIIQNCIQNFQSVPKLEKMKGSLFCQPPIENIYDFNGKFVLKTQENKLSEALKLQNTLWANTVLASGKIIGLVLFVGKETRMAMNARAPRSQFCQLDLEINFLCKLLFLFLIIISALIIFLRGIFSPFYQTIIVMIRYLILLSNVIPISMRVNLEFAINMDKEIKDTITRNSQIPEELGRIQFLLTDKTGTLTQNDMIFKQICVDQTLSYTEEQIGEIKRVLQEQCQKFDSPIPDVENLIQQRKEQKQQQQLKGKKENIYIQRDSEIVLRDLISALSLCHNVTPKKGENGEIEFEASSPDEVALVKTAQQMNMKLLLREQEKIIIENANGKNQEYKILQIFPFSSETKRMGIIIKHRNSGKIIFYVKGADVIMRNFIPQTRQTFVDEECENLAREGLRTLVFTQKFISQEQYDQWSIKLKRAQEDLKNTAEKVRRVVQELEYNMDLLGITGVQDKLQEDVAHSLQSLRDAGINIWMLTGDKIETAICISISSGLKAPHNNIFQIQQVSESFQLKMKIMQYEKLCNNHILVIDGNSLKTALSDLAVQELFFQGVSKAPAVVCCRCSPTQKAQIVECIKQFTTQITAAIGDGGNDVGMIQAADVGIGIVGKEGKQAALAADFSILKFKNITKLILWHGRLSYKRSSLLGQFVMHRGLIITIIQAVFTIIFDFIAMSPYNGVLLLGYSTIFTMFPVFSLIFDEDVDVIICNFLVQTALKFPRLYSPLQKGRSLNTQTFIVWFMRAVYQGALIVVLSVLLFPNSYFLNLQIISFTALIITQYLMTISQVQNFQRKINNYFLQLSRPHLVMFISNIGSAIIYLLVVLVFSDFLEMPKFEGDDIPWILLIVLVTWLPLYLIGYIQKQLDPTDFEIMMRHIKQGINTNVL